MSEISYRFWPVFLTSPTRSTAANIRMCSSDNMTIIKFADETIIVSASRGVYPGLATSTDIFNWIYGKTCEKYVWYLLDLLLMCSRMNRPSILGPWPSARPVGNIWVGGVPAWTAVSNKHMRHHSLQYLPLPATLFFVRLLFVILSHGGMSFVG